jgi:hypothetical protein
LKDLRRHTTPLALAFIIISDYEEECVGNIITKEVEGAQQPIEVE